MIRATFVWDSDAHGGTGWIPTHADPHDDNIFSGHGLTVAHDAVEHFFAEEAGIGGIANEIVALGAGLFIRIGNPLSVAHDFNNFYEHGYFMMEDPIEPCLEKHASQEVFGEVRKHFIKLLKESISFDDWNLKDSREGLKAFFHHFEDYLALGYARAESFFDGLRHEAEHVFSRVQQAVDDETRHYEDLLFEGHTKLTVEVTKDFDVSVSVQYEE